MWFSALFQRHRPRLDHLTVHLYTRGGCHLCDEAWALLEEVQGRFGFVLTAVDIDTNSELARQYGMCVPVVTVNGKVRFRGKVNPVLLERLFAAERRFGTNQGLVTRD